MWCLILLAFALRVQAEMFNITECDRDGKFYIWKHQQPSLTCTGLKEMLNIYWSLTGPSGKKEKKIGKCPGCNGTCPSCKGFDKALYNISRPDNESTTLQFLDTSQIIAGSTLKCSRYNNKVEATCLLFTETGCVIDKKKTTETVHQVSSTAWPVAAGAAGAAGFLLLLAAVIAIAVILRRRMLPDDNDPASNNYDGLRPQEVGVRSDYAELSHDVNTGMTSANGAGSNGEVGNRTEDSVRGDRDVAEERISDIYHEVDDTDAAEINDPTSAGHASDRDMSDKPTPKDSSTSNSQRAYLAKLTKAKTTRPHGELKVLNPTRDDEPEDMTETTESDDEYRSLRFTRPCQVDADSTYSHLTPL